MGKSVEEVRKIRVAASDRFWLAVTILSFTLLTGSSAADKSADKGAPAKAPSGSSARPDQPSSRDNKDLLSDNDPNSDDDFSDLVVPAGPLASAKPTDRSMFLQSLRGLLTEGMPEKGKDGTAAAKRHFEAARRLVADEPRAPYAYGIVLLAQKNPKEAMNQFRAAATKSKAPFLPALQGIVWLHVLQNEHLQGMKALLELAGRIEVSNDSWPTAQDREQSAEWIGRMTGYLTGPGATSDRDAVQIGKFADDVQKRLTAERKAAYERGRKAVADRHEELKDLAARPADEAMSEIKRQKEEIRTALVDAENELKLLDEEMSGLKKSLNKLVAELSRDLRAAGQNLKKANQELPDAAALVEDLSQPRRYATSSSSTSTRSGRTTTTVTRGTRKETTKERQAREADLDVAQRRLAQLQSLQSESNQRLDEARSQRAEAQAEFNRTAAVKRPELLEMRRKCQRLSARAQATEKALLLPEELKSRLTALDMYLPLDPAAEKSRLLATLKSPGLK